MLASTQNIKDTVLKALEETGLYFEYTNQDFDLRDLLQDSIQFITFLVNLEESLSIELPADLLLPEAGASFEGFCRSIENIKNQ